MPIEGFTPVPFVRLGSLVTRYPAETLPPGVSSEASNIRFGSRSIETREGLDPTYGLSRAPNGPRIVGLSHWANLPLIFTSDGHLYIEATMGGGGLRELIPETGQPFAGLLNGFMQTAHAYNNTYIAIADSNFQFGGGEPKFFDGTYINPVGMVIQGNGITTSQSAVAGNIDVGTRYCTFFFKTRSGFYQGFTDTAIVPVTLDGAHKVHIVFPAITVPSNVVAVVCAFTLAGATQNNDFFFIGEDQTVGSILNTSTVVPIPAPGTMPAAQDFDFTDEFLVGATNCTNFQDKITLPEMSNVAFLKSLQRFCWTGDSANPDVFYLSEPNDPETFFASGFVIPQQVTGEIAVGACELDNGEIVLLKQRSAWMLLPTADTPSTWEVRNRWTGHGPCGPRAFDVYQDTLAYAHRSGAYLSEGGGKPQLLTYEIEENKSGFASPSWDGINWIRESQIWCNIDGISKEIRFGVPYGESQTPNVVFKCHYGDGTESSIEETPDGLVVVAGRRWSVDFINAHSMVRLWRTLPFSPNPAVSVPKSIMTTQILVASALSDGAVSILNPEVKTDFGGLIVTRYRTAMPTPFAVNKIGGIEFDARGAGLLSITAFNSRSDPGTKFADTPLADDADSITQYCDENGFRWGLLLSTTDNPGDWWQILELVMYLKEEWSSNQ